VAVEKMEGVSRAVVSLEKGSVVVTLAEDNRVTLARLGQVIRDQGFTPREAEVRVRGVALREDGAWWFQVSGSGVRYAAEGSEGVIERLGAAAGAEVIVRGRVPVGEEATLRIVTVEGEPDPGRG